jgi:hypothetical protein
VFRNDPAEVAGIFRELLFGAAEWSRHFETIAFPVFDGGASLATFRAFETAFGGGG